MRHAVERQRIRRVGLEVADASPVVTTEGHDGLLADPELHLHVAVGAKGHDDLVGSDREKLRIVDHAETV